MHSLFDRMDRHPRTLALLAGFISALGFAPLSLWPLTLGALALLVRLVRGSGTARRAAMVGWLFGLGHFALGLNWIATAFTYQAAMPGWLGWVAVALLAIYLAVYPAIAAAAARIALARAAPLSFTRFAMLFGALWVVGEWLRSWVFTGFAWNPLGIILLPTGAARILSPVIGTYGLAAMPFLIIAGVAWLVGIARPHPAHHQPAPPAARGDALRLTAALGLPLAIGAAVALLPAPPLSAPPAHLTIVQPNIDQGDKWDMAQRRSNFVKLAALSPRRAGSPPRLLLWPEAAVPDYLEGGYPLDWYVEPASFARARLSALLGPEDWLLTGAVKLEPNADRTDIVAARNSLFSLDSTGQLGPRYDKSHLVPYGEYLPMRPILSAIGLSRLAPGAVDFWAGPGARTLDLRAQGFGRVGVQICYEIIFSGHVVDQANRPDFLYNPSNDAWFGAWGPPQHLAQARLRAMEEGLPVIRATPTGISAIIAADGRILSSIAPRRAGRIDALAPPPFAPTPFARFGNLLSLIFALWCGVWAVANRRRHR